ncbi:MAG: hypothetical protein RMJ05_08580 [Thermomicrobium sp.]|nr:hypothetical protein [Thermomicrobium sp.]MDW8006765.1 hypothetical protein [Thermomicrobium sp.]
MTSLDGFVSLRQRLLPMLRRIAEQLADRTVPGYPVLVDDPDHGVVGIALAPGFGLYIAREGERTVLRRERILHRTLVHTSAGREWFGGEPYEESEEIDPSISDIELRDEVARLLAAWHKHPLIIRQSDS